MAKPRTVEVEESFRVPSLGEVDADYRALVERRTKVANELAANAREQQALKSDLAKNRGGPMLRSAVGELVGDVIDIDERPKQLAELRKRAHDLEEAEAILGKRIADRKGAASVAVCNAVKTEFGARVKALARALEAAHAARLHFEDLLLDLEANDISGWTRLGVVRQPWMGDIQDGHIQRFIRKAKEAGYL